MKPLLQAIGISKTFGGLKAFQDVHLEAYPGKILTVIGPNGAGKTTLFNTLSGIYKPDGGKIFLNEKEIGGLKPEAICNQGLARTFQNIRLFKDMTALENVLIGEFCHDELPWPHILFKTKRFKHEEREALHRVFRLLEDLELKDVSNELARNLPYGFQRRLEIARALATRPKVLLLDEPGAGMNPVELNGLIKIIRKIQEAGLAIVLIEHHMKVVMEISDEIIVLDHGEELAKGKPEEISVNPQVISAYLGEALAQKGK